MKTLLLVIVLQWSLARPQQMICRDAAGRNDTISVCKTTNYLLRSDTSKTAIAVPDSVFRMVRAGAAWDDLQCCYVLNGYRVVNVYARQADVYYLKNHRVAGYVYASSDEYLCVDVLDGDKRQLPDELFSLGCPQFAPVSGKH